MTAEAGVLPLVVKAGGGSPRDTLSLLDQLIAGSEGTRVEYERATALLGYTSASLIDDVVTAVAEADAAGAFASVDRIVQTGQDPRRFVEDLLERMRDLIVVAATGDAAASVLRGAPADQIAALTVQAQRFGAAELSRIADTVSDALDEMVGATSPRLHLELMVARMLVPASDAGAATRIERLERRVGVESVAAAPPAPRPRRPRPPRRRPPPSRRPTFDVPPPSAAAPRGRGAARRPARAAPVAERRAGCAAAARDPRRRARRRGELTIQHVRDAWPEVLETVQRAKRSAWAVVYTSYPLALQEDVLTLAFVSRSDVEGFKRPVQTGGGVSEVLRTAILEVLGVRVKFLPARRRRRRPRRADPGRGARRRGAARRPRRRPAAARPAERVRPPLAGRRRPRSLRRRLRARGRGSRPPCPSRCRPPGGGAWPRSPQPEPEPEPEPEPVVAGRDVPGAPHPSRRGAALRRVRGARAARCELPRGDRHRAERGAVSPCTKASSRS